jgi:uncharacterized protein
MTLMLRKNIFKLAGVLVCLGLVAGFFLWRSSYENKIEPNQISIRGQAFKAEIVTTESDKQKGLGGRKSICPDCTMLFVFDRPNKYSFWMKDMLFALDILWLMDDEIVFMEKNVSPSFSGTINPPVNANRVLELNAGNVDKFGIVVGDSVLMN